MEEVRAEDVAAEAPAVLVAGAQNLVRAETDLVGRSDLEARMVEARPRIRQERHDKMIAFYTKTLGMRVTDRVPGIIAFLHLPGSGDHHVVALLADARPGFHHASFEVGSPDEIGLGAHQILSAGYKNGWGFGRHVLGSNFFHYLRDPWNSLAEYFCDIDQIPGDGSWQAEDHPAEDSLYLWGPEPGEFPLNFEEA